MAHDDGNLISSTWLFRALAAAELAGAPSARVRLDLGITSLDETSMVSRDLYLEMWERLVLATDRTLPLRAGLKAKMASNDVLACVCATMPTLGDAIHTLAKYVGAWTQAVRVEVRVDELGTTWVETHRVRPTARVGAAYADEFLVTDLLCGAGWVTGQRGMVPVGVRFAHARGAPLTQYRAALGVTPTFEAKSSAFGFSPEQCRAPLARHDPWMGSFAKESVERAVKERTGTLPAGSLDARVRREVVAFFGRGVPEVASIAKRLGFSERTLRRHLEAEGISFSALLDEVRREEALRLLNEGHMSASDIAARLGFSHLSSLHRACVRWTGRSPSSFRARSGAAGKRPPPAFTSPVLGALRA